jgi:hypothetical protein
MRIPPSSVAILPLNHGQSNKPAKPEHALAQGEQKTAPPGLERVLVRLQSLSNPTAGQSNATDRISRNLARYTETQAISTAPVASAEPTTPASAPTDAPVSGVEVSV